MEGAGLRLSCSQCREAVLLGRRSNSRAIHGMVTELQNPCLQSWKQGFTVVRHYCRTPLLSGPVSLGFGGGHVQGNELADRHNGGLGQEVMLAIGLRIMVGQLYPVAVQMVYTTDMLAVRADNFHMLFDQCFDFFGVHRILL
jgi:hypothetical protein